MSETLYIHVIQCQKRFSLVRTFQHSAMWHALPAESCTTLWTFILPKSLYFI